MKDKWVLLEYRYKIIILLSIFLVVGIIVGLILFVNASKGNEDSNIDNLPLITETEPPLLNDENKNNDPVKQSDVISSFRATVSEIIDNSSVITYKVIIGKGEYQTESYVKATMKTKFIDLDRKITAYPSSISEGSDIVIFSSGNYAFGELTAYAIGIGSNVSYSYAQIKEVSKITNDDSYIFDLYLTDDRLKVTSDTKLYNGVIGGAVYSASEIYVDSIVLYNYNPDFEITDKGNLYACNEFIVIEFGKFVSNE